MNISVTVEGKTPLLMNRFTEANEVKVSSGTSAAQIGQRGSPRDQAILKAYMDNDGSLYIPGPNIFACIIAAGTFHKAGKSKVTTQRSSLIPAGMAVQEIICSLGTKEFEIDSRSVVIPATGGRIMCHRPRLDRWSVKFTLETDESMFSPEFVRLLVDDAGNKVGLGDFRPARKGPFGRFSVVGWKVEKI
jgi:hypothetical protein